MKQMLLMGMVLALTGCAVVDRLRGTPPAVAVVAAPVAAPVQVAGNSAAALDSTTQAQRAAAVAAPASGRERSLGKVVVSLGSPAEQGIWLRSALVTEAGKGRVVTASGTSVAVDLRPGSGAAALSLAAFRALGLGLTDLPEVTVYAN